ncbi:hypothetical protein LCGC14_2653800 [marine sediment metagenome]|uniref:Uncharacterized protein n=1 Tax=marine sediment metagenome TaxID=412755 RepID=A0A0F9CL21_9ZZZZ
MTPLGWILLVVAGVCFSIAGLMGFNPKGWDNDG